MRTRTIARPAALATLSCTLVLLGPSVDLGHPSLALGARVAAAQDTSRIASPVLLKRLAEVVDGHRTGALLWVVASYDFPHPTAGVFERRLDAERAARDSGHRYDVFGPYKSQQDPGGFVVIIGGCVHLRSAMEPPYCPQGPALPLGDVAEMAITARLANGTTRSFPLAKGSDAVFFTLSAIDKFAMPYYTRILGVDAAAAMRRDVVRRLSSQ
jgi:hypothetical protein